MYLNNAAACRLAPEVTAERKHEQIKEEVSLPEKHKSSIINSFT